MIEFREDTKLGIVRIIKDGDDVGYISKFRGDNEYYSRCEINLWKCDHEQILAKMKALQDEACNMQGDNDVK